jgi:hypothetical protein
MYKSLLLSYPKIIIAVLMIFGPLAGVAQPQFNGFENLFTTPKNYTVTYVSKPPVIDGDITDKVWQQAKWTTDFVDIEGDLKPNPALKTNVKMLWGDSCLYIAAQIDDPHVWANLKRHDEIVFQDNDFEVFINPNNTTHQYYEIEFNALNTIFDLFLNKPYRNYGSPMISWDVTGMRSAVKVLGTLNYPSDTDKGWTVEMAIPFKAISLGNQVRIPQEGTLWRINFSRVEWDTKAVNGKYVKVKDNNGRNLPEHNWVWSAQGVVNMHFPERWGYLQFTKGNSVNDTFSLPYAEQQKRWLWLVYYKQKQWFATHKAYASSLKELDLTADAAVDAKVNTLQLEATNHQFMALITDKNDNITYTINQEGLVAQLNNR